MSKAPILMTEEYWANSQLSNARYYGGIKYDEVEYIIVNKEGKDLWECSIEAQKAGRAKAIEPGEPADLIDQRYQSIYKKVGRDTFIEWVKEGFELKEMKEKLKGIKQQKKERRQAMTNEEQHLLMQDLCARLPFNTMVRWQDEDYQMIAIGFGRVTLVKPLMSITAGSPLITEVKPYLRPMSSITEEEQQQISDFWIGADTKEFAIRLLDFYNQNHLDYRGLIPMGLAIRVTKENNPYKEFQKSSYQFAIEKKNRKNG